MINLKNDIETASVGAVDLSLEQLLSQQVRDWMRGDCKPLKSYIERRALFAADPEAIIELINQEIVLRRRRGDTPRPEDYVSDFPELAAPLSQLFDVYDAISLPTQVHAPPDVPAVADGTLEDGAVGRGPRIPNYKVERVLGSGGMGIVYLAHDLALKRDVALKVLRHGAQDDPVHRGRFEREAAAAAKCQHPNLVQIFRIGEHEGAFHLALEYVEGETLAKAMAGAPQPPRQAASLVEKLARAVDHAHSRGVVHRDLKPANVLMTTEGEPKITDFGLARLDDSSTRTEVGTLLGTLAYMAPEQANAGAVAVGAPADIHALGAILYEALTGRPPYRGDSPEKTLQKILFEEVVPPSKRQPGIPRDLEAISLKCLAKAPQHRYTTAVELAEDLRRFLEGRPTLARRASAPERVVRWCRRNPWMAASSALLVVGTTLITWQAVRATLAERAARLAEARTGKERDRAERSRDNAFSAVQAIVLTDNDQMSSEEARPYRQMLLDEGLRLARDLQQESEGDPRADELVAKALIMQAKILAANGEHTQAHELGQKAVEIYDALLERDRSANNTAVDHRTGEQSATMPAGDPSEIRSREFLAQLLHQFGTVATDRETGQAAGRRSNEVYSALLRENPQSHQAKAWINTIALNLHNIGNRYYDESQPANEQPSPELLHEAIEAFQKGAQFCNEHLDRGDQPNVALAPLAYNERYLCRAYRSLGFETKNPDEKARSLKKAIENGKKSISHFQSLSNSDPDSYQYMLELHLAERELGILFLAMEQWEESIRYYKMARETLKSMGQRHGKVVSRMVTIQEHLAAEDYNLINVLTPDSGANEKLLQELVDESYTICDKLDVVRPLSRDLRRVYAYVTNAKADFLIQSTGLIDIDLSRRSEQLYARLVEEDSHDFSSRCFGVVSGLELADGLALEARVKKRCKSKERR